MIIEKGKYARFFKTFKNVAGLGRAIQGVCYEIKSKEMSDAVDALAAQGLAERRSKKFVVCSGVVIEKASAIAGSPLAEKADEAACDEKPDESKAVNEEPAANAEDVVDVKQIFKQKKRK